MSKVPSISIIGGGASGTITAINLLNSITQPIAINIFESSKKRLHKGFAYSSELPYEPLNVAAGKMSAFSNLPDHFLNWLTSKYSSYNNEPITRETFVSRRWYGEYLQDCMQEAITKNSLAKVSFLLNEVTNLDYNEKTNLYKVKVDTNQVYESNFVVLATGNEPPFDLLSQWQNILPKNLYALNVWDTNALEIINPADDVLIIGTGLTMVDHVASLYHKNHTGTIYCVSRSGLLPKTHTNEVHFTINAVPESDDIEDVKNWLMDTIRTSKTNGVEWQNVLDGLRPHIKMIWSKLSLNSKKAFITKYKTHWDVHRHRMPKRSADILSEMISNNSLRIIGSSITNVERINSEIIITLTDNNTSQTHNIKVRKIINCIGPTGNYLLCNNRLINSLVQKGYIVQDELRLGIATVADGALLKKDGSILSNAFAIGPLRKATEWESTAIREIRQQAERTAAIINQKLTSAEVFN